MLSDIEIAGAAKLKKIVDVAADAGIPADKLECYGNYKAKVANIDGKRKAKLVLVTAINPTAFGEGKTTVSIGLADAMRAQGKNVIAALREPSLGPVFGVKGGATGGGYAQIAPMADINLHFNGDMHAITTANNLLSAMIENHVFQGNAKKIDVGRIVWRRCMDMNDRSLREVITGLGSGGKNGVTVKGGFDITAASEIMAILCLSKNIVELKTRIGDILVAYDYNGDPVYCRDINAQEAMTVLLKDAIKPNLVQTLFGTPALVHGGPFANIAHGCNSIAATDTAMKLGDYVVTEAGFGADLGAEKFLDVKCRVAGIEPSVVVIVATVRALKLNGGAAKDSLTIPDERALEAGYVNLCKHIENITGVFNLPAVVAINRFPTDSDGEIALLSRLVRQSGAEAYETGCFANGPDGAKELAARVIELCDSSKIGRLKYSYELNAGVKDKITSVVKRVYGGAGVTFTKKATQEIQKAESLGFGNFPVIIAKTQYSLSDNPALLGRPEGFTVKISDVQLRTGAKFIVATAGDMVLMPGLPKVPAAERMSIDNDGTISGLS